jgi:hypothetical protein
MADRNPLYVDPGTGVTITTHSMIKTMRRCPKQAQYKYVERLKPRTQGRPLRLGTWMHELQDHRAKGGDWREKHEEMKRTVWANLFDEEKTDIGDLPGDAERLMLSYLWHYRDDDWTYLESEFTLETEFPDGSLYRAKIDNLVENEFGLWIVDHKWHKRLPNHGYRILDSQSGLYVWAALRNGIPVQGHIWNYGLSKPATIPTMLKSGRGPARWTQLDTDYPTALKWFKDNGLNPNDNPAWKAKLLHLRGLRYKFGQPNASTRFQRVILEKSPAMLRQVAQEGFHTAVRMHDYPFERPEIVERVPDRSCAFMCSYTDLCSNELFLGRRDDSTRRTRFRVGDPMDYYQDEGNNPDKED